MRKHTFPKSIIIFIGLYMVAALSVAVTRTNWEFLAYIAVQAFIMAVVYVVHRRVGFSKGLLWGLAVWGLLHMAGGLVAVPEGWRYEEGSQPVLYSMWLIGETLKYDHVAHAFGFGLTTWLCWESLRATIQNRLGRKLYPSVGLVILCVGAGMGFGALNEVVEFFVTLKVPDTNVGGYLNTGWDLVANLVGCGIAGIAILFRG